MSDENNLSGNGAFGISGPSSSNLCCVCRCLMQSAVVIVPVFSLFFMRIGLIFGIICGHKLFRDTGKAEICVQCQLCRFNKMFDPFLFFFFYNRLLFPLQQSFQQVCKTAARRLLRVRTCWSSWTWLTIRQQQASGRKTFIDRLCVCVWGGETGRSVRRGAALRTLSSPGN